jgi:hypothetical protein
VSHVFILILETPDCAVFGTPYTCPDSGRGTLYTLVPSGLLGASRGEATLEQQGRYYESGAVAEVVFPLPYLTSPELQSIVHGRVIVGTAPMSEGLHLLGYLEGQVNQVLFSPLHVLGFKTSARCFVHFLGMDKLRELASLDAL